MSSSCAPSTSSDESASAPTNSRVSISESGSNEIVSAFGLPPPQLPRCSHSSGRAVHTTSNGTEAVLSIKPSRKSKSALSAQCKSSTTNTTGPLAAAASKNIRQPANASSSAPVAPCVSTPMSGASCLCTQTASTPASPSASIAPASLAVVVVASSESRISACCLTISATGQNATPSP